MSELLSDDQLSSLLGQAGAEVPGTDGDIGSGGGVDYQALQRAGGRFTDRAQSVLATVLNRKVTCEVISCAKTDPTEAGSALAGELLTIRMPLSGGLTGDLCLMMTKKDVAVLSDLMMLGDGTAPYNDDHKDAIAELSNQILGSYIAEVNGDGLTPPASAGTIEVKEGSLGQLPVPADTSAMGMVRLAIDGVQESRSLLLIPDVLGRQMASLSASPGAAAKSEGMQEGVGLSSQELSDLAEVSDTGGLDSGGFTETPLTSRPSSAPKENIDMLLDVDLELTIELGRANLSLKRILELAPGSIMELDRMAGEPVDLLVNNKVVAKGEVVVVDENFGIRIVSLVSAEDRIRSLR